MRGLCRCWRGLQFPGCGCSNVVWGCPREFTPLQLWRSPAAGCGVAGDFCGGNSPRRRAAKRLQGWRPPRRPHLALRGSVAGFAFVASRNPARACAWYLYPPDAASLHPSHPALHRGPHLASRPLPREMVSAYFGGRGLFYNQPPCKVRPPSDGDDSPSLRETSPPPCPLLLGAVLFFFSFLHPRPWD